jgi:hypothetical protein
MPERHFGLICFKTQITVQILWFLTTHIPIIFFYILPRLRTLIIKIHQNGHPLDGRCGCYFAPVPAKV